MNLDTQHQEVMSSYVNAMTIDVEDYFQVSAFASCIGRSEWPSIECRVEQNVRRILDMLARHDIHATFFILGWIAERYPGLVCEIAKMGHEIASHGYGHERASDLSRQLFFDDVVRAKNLLEDIAGTKVKGYRAPSFSIGQHNLWAFDVLHEAGYQYSSSVYPVKHDHYGMPSAPRFAFRIENGMVEIPPTTVHFFGRNFPASGGGFFRLFPYRLSQGLIQRVNEHEAQSAIFYFHPWEIDPEQPRVNSASQKSKFRHYLNLSKMSSRLEKLFSDFRWGRLDELFLREPVLTSLPIVHL